MCSVSVDIPMLRKAIESLNINRILTQDTFAELLQNSRDADLIATQILSRNKPYSRNKHSFANKMEIENKRKAVSDVFNYPETACKYSN